MNTVIALVHIICHMPRAVVSEGVHFLASSLSNSRCGTTPGVGRAQVLSLRPRPGVVGRRELRVRVPERMCDGPLKLSAACC